MNSSLQYLHSLRHGYSLQHIDGPAGEPITLDEAKAQCRVDYDSEDAYITALIPAARTAIEHEIGRAIGAQTFELGLRYWYDCDPRPHIYVGSVIEFPRPPLIELLSIKYKPWNADQVTLYDITSSPEVSTDIFLVDDSGQPGELWLRSGKSWPIGQLAEGFPIRIRFTAGLTEIRATLKQALLLMVAHLFDNREPVAILNGVQPVEIPRTVGYLIEGEKYWDFR